MVLYNNFLPVVKVSVLYLLLKLLSSYFELLTLCPLLDVYSFEIEAIIGEFVDLNISSPNFQMCLSVTLFTIPSSTDNHCR